MKLKACVVVVMFGICGSAFAGDSGLYVYGSAGKAQGSIDRSAVDAQVAKANSGATVAASVNNNPGAYKLNIGYQVTPILAVEVGYGATSDFDYTTTAPLSAKASEKLHIWDVVLASKLPLMDQLSLTFRGGYASVRTSGSGSVVKFDGRKSQVTGGIGLKYDFDERLSVRVDWDGYKAPADARIDQVNLFSVGMGYKF